MWYFSSLKQIADSWSAYVKTPTKIPKTSSETVTTNKVAQEPVIHPQTAQTSTTTSTNTTTAKPGLLRNITTSIGGWVFHSQEEEHNQVLKLENCLQTIHFDVYFQ